MYPAQKRTHRQGKPRGPRGPPLDSSDPVNVFCRIRPLPISVEKCVERKDDKTVQLTVPASSVRNAGGKDSLHTFQYVFDEQASQNEVFEDVGLPLVGDLVQGKNGLLFTYGITSSGKTFTMQGHPDHPGILPRTLDVLFNSIGHVLAERCTFKSDGQNGFTIQTAMDALLERQRKERESDKVLRGRGKGKEDEGEFALRAVETATVSHVDADSVYAVYVSYVEIYNNYAYDLLQPDLGEPGKPTTLLSHGLRDDASGRVYVAGVTEVEVQNADEALRLLCRGQKARRIASTGLNGDSSRSHVIFNVRVVQAPLDETGMQVLQDSDVIRLSQLSLIDLAGSERTKRTKNDGDRLREAGNINASLLTLRKCLDALRLNQAGEQTYEMVPYRESKLTHLFKTFFEGDGKVRMIVCLNPAADEYDETVHVLRFAESTQRVQVGRSQQVRFDQLGFAAGRRAAAEESKKRAKENLEFSTEDDVMTECRRTKQSSFTKSYEFHQTFPSLQLSHHTDSQTLPSLARFLEERIARHKSMYGSLKEQDGQFMERLKALMLEKDHIRRENNALKRHLEEKNRVASQLEKELNEQMRVRDVLMHHSTLSEEAKIDLMGRLHDREYAITQEHLKRQKYQAKLQGEARKSAERRQRELEKEMKSVRNAMSNKMEWQGEKLKRIRDVIDGGCTPTAPFPSSTTSTLSDASRTNTAQRAVYSRHKHLAPTNSNLQLSASKSPFHNPRYALVNRRSSGKMGKFVDHRSQHRVPMGTHLQPPGASLRRRKSITQPDLKATKGADHYYLEHQEGDGEGNVQTQIFKGDIIPTAAGGRSVIFRDCEVLRQMDPLSLDDLRRSAGERCLGREREMSVPRETIAERCAVGTAHYSPTKSPSKPARMS